MQYCRYLSIPQPPGTSRCDETHCISSNITSNQNRMPPTYFEPFPPRQESNRCEFCENLLPSKHSALHKQTYCRYNIMENNTYKKNTFLARIDKRPFEEQSIYPNYRNGQPNSSNYLRHNNRELQNQCLPPTTLCGLFHNSTTNRHQIRRPDEIRNGDLLTPILRKRDLPSQIPYGLQTHSNGCSNMLYQERNPALLNGHTPRINRQFHTITVARRTNNDLMATALNLSWNAARHRSRRYPPNYETDERQLLLEARVLHTITETPTRPIGSLHRAALVPPQDTLEKENDTLVGRQLINCLPISNYSTLLEHNKDDQLCAVCLEDYCDGDNMRRLPCMHHFHTHCIDEWLSRSSICPICKTSIKHDSNTFRGSEQLIL